MQQDGGASSLEQFKLLAKTACGRACVALIQQVLGSKNVYVFGELLEMPNVVALQGTEHEPYFDLLQLFARGTYAEYKTRATELPEMNHEQTKKLRKLTVVSMAHQNNVVSYDVLKQELGLSCIREVEDLVISTVYSGLIKAKLNQKESCLVIHKAMGRDVRKTDLVEMMAIISNWCNSADLLVQSINAKIEYTKRTQIDEKTRQQKLESDIQVAKKNLRFSDADAASGMNLDHDDPVMLRRRGKRRHVGPSAASKSRW